ncbi:hypothetical protein D3C72_1971500 [compost metagenome]
MYQRISVDLRGRGEEVLGPLGSGELQERIRAHGADLEGFERQLEVVDGARGAREVQDPVERPDDLDGKTDIMPEERERRMPLQVGDVGKRAGDEVVDRDDREPLGQQPVHQVRADEAGAPGDEYPFHPIHLPTPM